MRNLSKIQYLNTGLPIRIQWRTIWWKKKTDDLGGTGYKPFKHCPFHNCLIIPTTENLSAVDAYIFHFSLFRNGDVVKIPRHRSPEQKYIFFTKESESRCTIPCKIPSLFNLTMSHGLDSDIPQPYGVIRRKLSSDSIPRTGTNFAVGKTGLVAWVASNCHTASRREVYIARLQKYINVDIYGGCGNSTCPKSYGKVCWEHFNQKYKFYLAFKNILCEDYITGRFIVLCPWGKWSPLS